MTPQSHPESHQQPIPDVTHMQDLLLQSAVRAPESVAVTTVNDAWSFDRVLKRSRQYAHALCGAGLKKGDRAALLMDNGPEYVAAYFGVFLAGGVAVPLDLKAHPDWLRVVLADCDVMALLTSPQLLPKLKSSAVRTVVTSSATPHSIQDLARSIDVNCHSDSDINFPADPTLPAVINYTSGSSGRPKGVVVSHKAILANTRSIVAYLGLTEQDRVMQILPFSYCYGASLLHTHFLVGGSVTIDNRFQYPSAVLEHLKSSGCTGFAGVPSTFHTLVTRCAFKGADYPCLRYVTQAGGRMDPKLVDAVREVISPVRLYIMYGQTEASSRLTYLEPEFWGRKRGSAGRPIPGVSLKVILETGREASTGETGEIWVAGENLMSGYWHQPDETAQVLVEGWLRTGDLGHVDEDGFLYIESRLSELIKSHGYRISPAEVEEVVSRHPAVREAAVLGLPDVQLGEVVSVVLALNHGASLGLEDLQKHCRQFLPVVKVPRRIVTVSQLPRSSSGKLQKEKLLQLFA